MRSGQLRDEVRFDRRAEMDDGLGNVRSGDWVELSTMPADILERLGGERIAAGALESNRLATVRVRASPEAQAVTEGDSAVFRGLRWNVRAIAYVGRKGDQLEMTCEAGVAT